MNERTQKLLLGLLLVIGAFVATNREEIQQTIRTLAARGIRNNNPGNLELTDIPWRGKVPRLENTDGRFEQFYTAFDGIRALARDLTTKTGRGLDTIRKIIEVYAPPFNDDGTFENDTVAYIKSVSKRTGIGADEPINFDVQKFDLVNAIIFHEQGENPYPDALIREAIAAA